MSNAPVKKFRLGYLTATIWENDKAQGEGKWYSVELSRTYKNGEDELSNTNSLNHADLLNGARLLTRCEAWIADK